MSNNVHLLVLIHGMWGNPSHLFALERVMQEVKKTETDDISLETLVARANEEDATYDGIDWGAERVADEIEDKIKSLESSGRKVTKFSAIGYSLGGLVARYVLGIFHQKGRFDTIEPMNFATIATPHIGLLRYNTFYSSMSFMLGPAILSRTGEQFFAVDKWSATGRPLLEVMADPDRIFYQALSRFPQINIYANGVNDTTVPYATAAIESSDPFVGRDPTEIAVEFEPDYKPLIKSYKYVELPVDTKPKSFLSVNLARFSPSRVLPPVFNLRFPLNIIPYLLFPILVPILFTLAIARLSLSARSSRARIRILEKDDSARHKLLNIVAKLEREMEGAVVNADKSPSQSPPQSSSGINTPAEQDTHPSSKITSPISITATAFVSKGKETESEIAEITKPQSSAAPIFTPSQLRMVEWLNALPNMRKHIAYLDHLRNSHGTIVSRDLKNYSFHKRGEGVLRHCADSFIL